MGLGKASKSASTLYWSHDDGLVHWIGISSLLTLQKARSLLQLSWLENYLREAFSNRAQVPWIVLLTHSCEFMSHVDLATVWPVVLEARVDVVFCGHRHEYTRLWPYASVDRVHSDTANPQQIRNPIYPLTIVSGTGCNRELGNATSGSPSSHVKVTTFLSCGFSTLSAVNHTHIVLTYKETDAVGGHVFHKVRVDDFFRDHTSINNIAEGLCVAHSRPTRITSFHSSVIKLRSLFVSWVCKPKGECHMPASPHGAT